MKSVMTPQQYFNHVAKPDIQRSTFDRSHGLKTTLEAGVIVPIFVDEALPGDTFNIRATLFGRLSTPIKPIMDNLNMDVHWFSVPYRLVWSNWKKFNGEQNSPGDSTNFLIPQLVSPPSTGWSAQSPADYFGIPINVPGLSHSALPFRALNLIWNEWYRDENLLNPVPVPLGDGPDNPVDYLGNLPRGKRKDYFTSALPWAQKGTAVSIPLGSNATVKSSGIAPTFSDGAGMTDRPIIRNSNANTQLGYNGATVGSGAGAPFVFGTTTGLYADLSTATATTINQLRQAFQIQRMYERDARGGTRYTEVLRSHFGVISPDARLQRPEYLGGGTVNINVNPVAQTAPSISGQTPQGNLAAIGTVTAHNIGFTKSFTEHEIVIGLVSIRADLNYQQGLNRMWSRQTRFDFYWPSLAHLGEQAILNKEIYAQGSANPTADEGVFGYQERYAEYRYKPSLITGKFRSTYSQPLDIWHLAQKFNSLPALNGSFIVESIPLDRVVAVTSEPKFLLDCFFNFKAARPMPTFSTPGLIDHF